MCQLATQSRVACLRCRPQSAPGTSDNNRSSTGRAGNPAATRRLARQLSVCNGAACYPSAATQVLDLPAQLLRQQLWLVDSRMRQWPGVVNDRAKVANINPPAAIRASDVAVRGFPSSMPQPFIETLTAQNGPHRKASFTRWIAGCSGFFTFTQFGETPAQ
jgi:hypothetical protein